MNDRALELHPDCRHAWNRGLTDYPKEEHARDCDKCQQWQHEQRRIRLAEARGWVKVTENRWVPADCKGKGPLDWDDRDAKYAFELPDPENDANDDYAVLESMRKRPIGDRAAFDFALVELVDNRKEITKASIWMVGRGYEIGDYARARLKLLDTDEDRG
ncbi:hypothetical protein LCGC14_1631830 [marine sediment metagenome]|uniref:Uncharacterized protein n=1 Tax=marine sediment metagenome TaxID=412755 RepID=A0A0F9I2N4_9ZZZZ